MRLVLLPRHSAFDYNLIRAKRVLSIMYTPLLVIIGLLGPILCKRQSSRDAMAKYTFAFNNDLCLDEKTSRSMGVVRTDSVRLRNCQLRLSFAPFPNVGAQWAGAHDYLTALHPSAAIEGCFSPSPLLLLLVSSSTPFGCRFTHQNFTISRPIVVCG